MLMDLKPAITATTTTAAFDNDDDDNDNNKAAADNSNRQLEASGSKLAVKDHVNELLVDGNQQTSSADERQHQHQQQEITTSESRSRSVVVTPEPLGESCTVTATTTAESKTIAAGATESTNESEETTTTRDEGRRPTRARLVQAKSVSFEASATTHNWQPVAPPRARKRQSVPFARVPGELVARHNAALAEIAASVESSQIAEETVGQEEGSEAATAAATAAATETSSFHPANSRKVADAPAAKAVVLRDDSQELPANAPGSAVAVPLLAEIDYPCAAGAISSEPQAAASSVFSPLLLSSAASPATAPTDHRGAAGAGSGGGTISSIFARLMGKSRELQQQNDNRKEVVC